jgi:hypothetical protein
MARNCQWQRFVAVARRAIVGVASAEVPRPAASCIATRSRRPRRDIATHVGVPSATRTALRVSGCVPDDVDTVPACGARTGLTGDALRPCSRTTTTRRARWRVRFLASTCRGLRGSYDAQRTRRHPITSAQHATHQPHGHSALPHIVALGAGSHACRSGVRPVVHRSAQCAVLPF